MRLVLAALLALLTTQTALAGPPGHRRGPPAHARAHGHTRVGVAHAPRAPAVSTPRRAPARAWTRDYRPTTARPGYRWVVGTAVHGAWRPGYWAPVAVNPGHVWVPGFWNGAVYVDGHWRVASRPGYLWVPGHYDGYTWVAGFWRPAQVGGPVVHVRVR